jgi:hypothetical protein
MFNQKFSKRRVYYVVLSFLSGLLLAGIGVVSAASTTKTLSTNFTLVNLGSGEANVSVQYSKDDGSSWAAEAANTVFTLTANGGQKIVAQYLDTTLSSGRGSAVVSSDQPLAGIVQILARGQTPTSGAYTGFTNPATTFYVPLAIRRGTSASGTTNSQIIIQNSSSSPVNVTVQLKPSPGFTGAYTKTITSLQAGVSYYYDLDDETNLATTPWLGSAVVSATGNVSVIVNLFLGVDGLQTYNAFPASSVGLNWSIPLFTSRLSNGLNTPISIQNLSGGTIAAGGISVSCTAVAGSPASFTMTNTTSIANQAGYGFNPVVDMTIPGNWSGACRMTSTGTVVVFVQMRQIGTANNAAYEALNASSTDKKVFAPLVSKRQANGFATATTLQNLSAVITATVALTYTPSAAYVAGGGSPALLTKSVQIGPNGSLVENQRLAAFTVGVTPMPDGWYGVLTASSTQAIGGFTQLTNINTLPGDTLMAFTLFTQP